uniref:Uncharacterized protein LOC102808848 n=1 Tax=Saccoglossus kowalevskii TaxID=10224 RepID=A0ABM0LZJ1_SACKO|nr:PREDICTED: uncharacterized protein LOC102808848 [Saccoglossus kowalevskii]
MAECGLEDTVINLSKWRCMEVSDGKISDKATPTIKNVAFIEAETEEQLLETVKLVADDKQVLRDSMLDPSKRSIDGTEIVINFSKQKSKLHALGVTKESNTGYSGLSNMTTENDSGEVQSSKKKTEVEQVDHGVKSLIHTSEAHVQISEDKAGNEAVKSDDTEAIGENCMENTSDNIKKMYNAEHPDETFHQTKTSRSHSSEQNVFSGEDAEATSEDSSGRTCQATVDIKSKDQQKSIVNEDVGLDANGIERVKVWNRSTTNSEKQALYFDSEDMYGGHSVSSDDITTLTESLRLLKTNGCSDMSGSTIPQPCKDDNIYGFNRKNKVKLTSFSKGTILEEIEKSTSELNISMSAAKNFIDDKISLDKETDLLAVGQNEIENDDNQSISDTDTTTYEYMQGDLSEGDASQHDEIMSKNTFVTSTFLFVDDFREETKKKEVDGLDIGMAKNHTEQHISDLAPRYQDDNLSLTERNVCTSELKERLYTLDSAKSKYGFNTNREGGTCMVKQTKTDFQMDCDCESSTEHGLPNETVISKDNVDTVHEISKYDFEQTGDPGINILENRCLGNADSTDGQMIKSKENSTVKQAEIDAFALPNSNCSGDGYIVGRKENHCNAIKEATTERADTQMKTSKYNTNEIVIFKKGSFRKHNFPKAYLPIQRDEAGKPIIFSSFKQFAIDETFLRQQVRGKRRKAYLKCQLCPCAVEHRASLKRHYFVHHVEDKFKNLSGKSRKMKIAEQNEKVCNRDIGSRRQIHNRTLPNTTCNSINVQENELPNSRKLRSAVYHEKQNKKDSAMLFNEEDVDDEVGDHKPLYPCKICGQLLKSHKYLVEHMSSHTNQEIINCPECPRQFLCKAALDRHFLMHSGDKLYSCTYCDNKFSTLDGWRKHEKLHSGFRPHKCDKCKITFIHETDLQRHMNMKHTDNDGSEEVKSPCTNPNATVDQNDHSKSPKNHKCTMCQRIFRKSSGLRRHMNLVHKYFRLKPMKFADYSQDVTDISSDSSLDGFIEADNFKDAVSDSLCQYLDGKIISEKQKTVTPVLHSSKEAIPKIRISIKDNIYEQHITPPSAATRPPFLGSSGPRDFNPSVMKRKTKQIDQSLTETVSSKESPATCTGKKCPSSSNILSEVRDLTPASSKAQLRLPSKLMSVEMRKATRHSSTSSKTMTTHKQHEFINVPQSKEQFNQPTTQFTISQDSVIPRTSCLQPSTTHLQYPVPTIPIIQQYVPIQNARPSHPSTHNNIGSMSHLVASVPTLQQPTRNVNNQVVGPQQTQRYIGNSPQPVTCKSTESYVVSSNSTVQLCTGSTQRANISGGTIQKHTSLPSLVSSNPALRHAIMTCPSMEQRPVYQRYMHVAPNATLGHQILTGNTPVSTAQHENVYTGNRQSDVQQNSQLLNLVNAQSPAITPILQHYVYSGNSQVNPRLSTPHFQQVATSIPKATRNIHKSNVLVTHSAQKNVVPHHFVQSTPGLLKQNVQQSFVSIAPAQSMKSTPCLVWTSAYNNFQSASTSSQGINLDTAKQTILMSDAPFSKRNFCKRQRVSAPVKQYFPTSTAKTIPQLLNMNPATVQTSNIAKTVPPPLFFVAPNTATVKPNTLQVPVSQLTSNPSTPNMQSILKPAERNVAHTMAQQTATTKTIYTLGGQAIPTACYAINNVNALSTLSTPVKRKTTEKDNCCDLPVKIPNLNCQSSLTKMKHVSRKQQPHSAIVVDLTTDSSEGNCAKPQTAPCQQNIPFSDSCLDLSMSGLNKPPNLMQGLATKNVNQRGGTVTNDNVRTAKSDTLFACNVCRQAFYSVEALREHVVLHGNEWKFKCENCAQLFKYTKDCETHALLCAARHDKMRSTQIQERASSGNELNIQESIEKNDLTVAEHLTTKSVDFRGSTECQRCGRGFTNWENLQKHNKMCPNRDKMRIANWTRDLTKMMSTYDKNGQQLIQHHKCPHCQRKFTYIQSLKKHIEICINKTADAQQRPTALNESSSDINIQNRNSTEEQMTSRATNERIMTTQLLEDRPMRTKEGGTRKRRAGVQKQSLTMQRQDQLISNRVDCIDELDVTRIEQMAHMIHEKALNQAMEKKRKKEEKERIEAILIAKNQQSESLETVPQKRYRVSSPKHNSLKIYRDDRQTGVLQSDYEKVGGMPHMNGSSKPHKPNPVKTYPIRRIVHSGMGETYVNNFLASLNILRIHHKTLKKREREAGVGIENVTKRLCVKAITEEQKLSSHENQVDIFFDGA